MSAVRYPLHPERLSIFLFHGVIEQHTHAVRNYNRKHIDRKLFLEVLTDWKSAGTALTMDDVVEHHHSKRPYPRNAFAITFDDGFENNLSIAAPILADLNLPAMFYLTTGWIGSGSAGGSRMSWIDRIEEVFERAPSGSIALPWNNSPCSYATPDEKIAVLEEIRRYAKSHAEVNREQLADDFARELGVEPVKVSDDPLDRKLSWNQVKALAAEPGFSVAPHSHTHAILSFLSGEDLQHELQTSIETVERNTGIRGKHYAYPDGGPLHYNQAVIEALQSLGVVCCPTAISGTNGTEDSLFDLKRIMVV